MRIILKYFMLIILLQACRENDKQNAVDNGLSLYAPPLTVALDTTKGYNVNLITGDSIKPLLNTKGEPIKTGIPVPFIPNPNGEADKIKTTIITGVQAIKTIIRDNVYPIPANLAVTVVDTNRLTKVKLGAGDPSLVLRNSFGTIPTGIPFAVTGKKMPFSEPHPVKAAPMRFKDNASISVEYLDVEQGLSYSYVEDVYEDHKGNLWFAMDAAGVNRYDGINITNYTEKEGLSGNSVHCIMEDRNDNLWFATQGGLTCFDGTNFIRYSEKEGFPSNLVGTITKDKKGDLWICTAAGVLKYNGKDFVLYTTKEGLPSDTVNNCIEDSHGNIWFATDHGAAKFDGAVFTHYTQREGLAAEKIVSILEDRKGNLWLGTNNNGINIFDGKGFTHLSKKEGLSSDLILSMMRDKNDNIWIGTLGGGVDKFDGENFTQYNLEQGLSNNKARKIIQDKSGNIWFGTDGGGVNKINAAGFEYPLPEELMDNNRIRPMLKDKSGDLWFGTDDGHVGKLDAEPTQAGGRLFTYYKVQDKLLKGQRSLLQDKKGNIWIGTSGEGIIKYDGTNFTKYSLGSTAETETIFDMLEDKKGNIWFCTYDGYILRYDGSHFLFYSTAQGLPDKKIFSMLQDKKGNTWFCTGGAGVFKYDGTYLIDYTEKEGLFFQNITSVTEDAQGNIWLASQDNGVCRFDGSSFTYFTVKQGLADNNVWSAFCDTAGHLWFGTNKGLTRFVPQNKHQQDAKPAYTLYNYGSRDGMKAIDFNLHSVCLDKDNRIWWGTGKSVISYDLDKRFQADSVRSLSLNHIEINERYYDFRNLPDSARKKISCRAVLPNSNCPQDLSLSYDLNHLSFHFSAIDWSAPDKIKYSYRLVGLDEKWSTPSKEAIAEYRNLGHGNYQFLVRAIGQSQVWTEPISYSFSILPAWWQTVWFKALLIALALLVIFLVGRFIYFYQLRKQKTILEKQLAVEYERQRISAEMHDDIGAGLSGIRLMTEMVKLKAKDDDNVSEIEKIYHSVGDISSKMKEVIWSLNTENDSLDNLLSYLQKQARQMMEHYSGSFTITMPEQIPDIKIGGETRRHIYLAVKEALHNIIKHSGADKVHLDFACNGKLVIRVSDNGKGMDTLQSNQTGNGLKNMKNRMEEIGGKFSVENNHGLTLQFEIPLKAVL